MSKKKSQPTNKPSRRNSSDFITFLLFLTLIAIVIYLYQHPKPVQNFIQKNNPVVQNWASQTADKTKTIAQTGLKKTKELYLRFTKQTPPPDSVKTLPSPVAESKPVKIKMGDKSDITISSFNIRIFSNKSRTDEELQFIAQILKHYDLIAIQELRDETVLKRTIRLLKSMGYEYDYEISPAVGRQVKENYAFLYRKDKITVKQKGQLYVEKDDLLIREPFYAWFQSNNFDFILVTTHLLYGENAAHRRPEIIAMAKVYNYIQTQYPHESDVILLGDFNLEPTDDGWDALKRLPTMTYLIKPPEKTTITDTSLYDNFWFQRSYVREYIGQSGVIRFDENIFQNNDHQAKLAVSDHRPIWARFSVSMADDD